ncbi:hypothetical protein BGZ61DRAFT_449757 [Ilyonectria robusta]|uniref:uncharacterized protein n=1 Tax=Ilyonectria robusta TaxID=1079257 RepID=UPI001E8D6059|nr:uncharacterized protein BGZ61DRAFT_449757 [Ilyonectria robusta]KAH8706344.1 hypothetical protein BGZ61DRAFT_449757 [Ilyonectria robusta]
MCRDGYKAVKLAGADWLVFRVFGAEVDYPSRMQRAIGSRDDVGYRRMKCMRGL